ncbi:MAG: response regulator [Candidatus Micrarchaeota archaeon]|nr:response regulator [Candidatus Micrarchaeota archaeon]
MEIDDLRLEQDILAYLKARDKAMETNEIIKEFSDYHPDDVKGALVRLKTKNKLEARSIGQLDFWYVLDSIKPKKILIIEDDKDINNLIRLSLGEDRYEIKSTYDGEEGLKEINIFKPDLIILDLMLPGIDGLEICKKVKSNQETKNTIVVIVSAADATVNRFFGIQYGADYYIKKPFDPMELRALVNIFLNKSGDLFDPLVDLPDVERLVNNIKLYLNEQNSKFIKLEIEGINEYENVYGEKAKMKLVRLISQMIQDKITDFNEKIFFSYLGDSSFLLVSDNEIIYTLLSELEAEFRRVNQFIKQKQLSKSLYQKLESGSNINNDHPIRLVYYDINIDAFKKQFEKEIIKDDTEEAIRVNIAAIRNYSLDQIRACFEKSKDVDITIKEIGGTLRITAGKEGKK